MYSAVIGVMTLPFLSLFLFLPSLKTPLSLLFSFVLFVVWGTFAGYLFVSDFFPYMLYLVYIGGLLVLLIYMVIISTNYRISTPPLFLPVVICVVSMIMTVMAYLNGQHSPLLVGDKMLSSDAGIWFNLSALIILVVILLYTFMCICECVRLGGRALSLGKT